MTEAVEAPLKRRRGSKPGQPSPRKGKPDRLTGAVRQMIAEGAAGGTRGRKRPAVKPLPDRKILIPHASKRGGPHRGRAKGTPRTGGRVKGTPNRVSSDMKERIVIGLDIAGGARYARGQVPDGAWYFADQARENPVAFMALCSKVLPLQLTGAGNGPLLIEQIASTALTAVNAEREAEKRLAEEGRTIEHVPATYTEVTRDECVTFNGSGNGAMFEADDAPRPLGGTDVRPAVADHVTREQLTAELNQRLEERRAGVEQTGLDEAVQRQDLGQDQWLEERRAAWQQRREERRGGVERPEDLREPDLDRLTTSDHAEALRRAVMAGRG